MSPRDMMYDVALLVGHPHKLTLVVRGSFSVAAVNTPTVIIKRHNKSVDKISLLGVAKLLQLYEQKKSGTLPGLDENSLILDVSARHRLYAVTLHGFALEKVVCG